MPITQCTARTWGSCAACSSEIIPGDTVSRVPRGKRAPLIVCLVCGRRAAALAAEREEGVRGAVAAARRSPDES